MIAVYVSGHGFGHATRVSEVLRRLQELAPDVALTVSSAAPEALFQAALPKPFTFRKVQADVGLVQKDALRIDLAATERALAAFESGFSGLVEREALWLRECSARLVLGDIPPLACAAATHASIPSVALGNFSWDWIYRHLSRGRGPFEAASKMAASAYATTALLLELPFAGDLSAFPTRRPIPLVARVPVVSREEARSRLGLGKGPLVLWSFGGLGLPGFDFLRLDGLRAEVVTVGAAAAQGVRTISNDALARASLGYIDLVGACDAIITKPGYGIVSDAIGGRSRLLYTDRGDFPEYPIIVEGMKTLLPTRYISNEDLLAGRLGPALEELRARPMPPAPDLSGADVAARSILEVLRS